MLLPSSLNTISLDIHVDKYLLMYPFGLLLLSISSLLLANILWWLKLFLLIGVLFVILQFCFQYVLLVRAKSVIKVEYKQKWLLHYQDRSVDVADLNSRTVYTPFMVFLLFKVNNSYKRVIVRRNNVDAMQYDALYLYLNQFWKPDSQ